MAPMSAPERSDVAHEPEPASFDAAWAAVASVEGWLADSQARRLYDAARRVVEGGRIVEIGSYHGRSAIVEALAAPQAGEVVAIDPHGGNDRGPQQWDGDAEDGDADNRAFEANLAAAGVRDHVRHVRQMSTSAFDDVPGAIDLLYVDGSHRFAAARADIVGWGAKVNLGGTMLVHDAYSSIGVTGALLTTTAVDGRWRYIGRSRSMTEYRRENLAGLGRITNIGRQLGVLPWFARNLLIKALIAAKLGKVTELLGHDGHTWPY